VPVDTYLKGKNLSRYRTVEQHGLRIHVAPALSTWAENVEIDATRFLFWKKFEVAVAHRHQPT
jgi:hypothetical protein